MVSDTPSLRTTCCLVDFTRTASSNALQSYYKNHPFPNFDPRSVQISVKKP